MKAIIVESPGGPVKVTEMPVPDPGAGQVLVKITAAPVNPTDIAGIRRKRPADEFPFVPGREGAGVVVKAGSGLLPKLWFGKRVSVSPMPGKAGTWAEYILADASHCFPLGKKVSDEQGSMSLVNPLTAIGFIEIAKKGRHKAVINNAGASALGRMLELLCRKEGIKLINIVRSERQVEALKRKGSEFVLNSSDPDFSGRLTSLASELKANLLFDSVCGPGFTLLSEAIPERSTIVIYGNLSPEEYININPRTVLSKDLKITGFFLGNRTRENGMLKNVRDLLKVRNLMSSDLKIRVRATYPLAEAQRAIDDYLADMTAGKILLVP